MHFLTSHKSSSFFFQWTNKKCACLWDTVWCLCTFTHCVLIKARYIGYPLSSTSLWNQNPLLILVILHNNHPFCNSKAYCTPISCDTVPIHQSGLSAFSGSVVTTVTTIGLSLVYLKPINQAFLDFKMSRIVQYLSFCKWPLNIVILESIYIIAKL